MSEVKTVLITGATGGLGQSIANEFYEKEFHLILTGTNDEKLEALRSKFDRNTNVIKCNLAKISDIENLFTQIKPKSVDILINNAGALYFSRMESIDKIEKTFALNHLSYFALTNLLLQNKNIKRGGRIINVASGAHKRIDIDFEDLETKKN